MPARDNKIFICVCILLAVLTILFILNLWYKIIPHSYVDKYVIVLFLTVIGLSLLPFADKVKIGNLFEIQRLKAKIEEVQLYQYLGEIIKTPQGDIFYYDSEGIHRLPDKETVDFLKTKKGEILVTVEILNQMKNSYPIESVKTSEKIRWGGQHIFVVLNHKKYWVSPTDLTAILPDGNTDKIRQVTDEQIRLIPSGK